jgi:hypothetical protein
VREVRRDARAPPDIAQAQLVARAIDVAVARAHAARAELRERRSARRASSPRCHSAT